MTAGKELSKALKATVGTNYQSRDMRAGTSYGGKTDVTFRDGTRWMKSEMMDAKLPTASSFTLSSLPGSGLVD